MRSLMRLRITVSRKAEGARCREADCAVEWSQRRFLGIDKMSRARAKVAGGQVVEAENDRRRVGGVVGRAQQVHAQREAQAGRRQQPLLAICR